VGGGSGSCVKNILHRNRSGSRSLWISSKNGYNLQGVHWGVTFGERINSCANQIVTTGNTNLGDDLVDKTTVLRMNKKIMKFIHLKYPNILKQRFPTVGTVITVFDNEQDDVEIDSD